MPLRILAITKEDHGEITQLKEVPFAYMDGTLLGMSELDGQPIKLTISDGKIEPEIINLHTASYSRRKLRSELADMMAKSGPPAFDALSLYSDLSDTSVMVWDDLRPRQLNPTLAPVVENGPAIKGQVKPKSQAAPDDDEDEDDT